MRRAIAVLVFDVRLAARRWCRDRLMAVFIVATLSTTLALVAAVGGLGDAILMRPLPYPGAGRLVCVQGRPPYDTFMEWGTQARSLVGLAMVAPRAVNVAAAGGDPMRLLAGEVSSSYLDVLGVRLAEGRSFRPEEYRPGTSRVALISHALAALRFGGSRKALGRVIEVDGLAHVVLGVLPIGFAAHSDLSAGSDERTDLLIPLTGDPARRNRRARSETAFRGYSVVGRLRPGVSIGAARAELGTIAARSASDSRRADPIRLRSLAEQVRGDTEGPLFVLAGACVLMMLLASTNIGSLLLARALQRRGDYAIQTALGASRARIATQVAVEGGLLGVAGAACGCFGAAVVLGVFSAWWAPLVPGFSAPSVSVRVVLVTLAAALLIAGGSALPAVWRVVLAGGAAPGPGNARASAGPSQVLMQRVLVVAATAMTLVLLLDAQLLIQHLSAVVRTDLGFRSDDVVVADVALTPTRYRRAADVTSFLQRLLQATNSAVGVESAAVTNAVPMGPVAMVTMISVEGWAPDAGQVSEQCRLVSSRYFETLGIPLVAGRLFALEDGSEKQVVVSEPFARKYWGAARSAVGRRLGLGPVWYAVAGVVAGVRESGRFEAPAPEVYFPYDTDLSTRQFSVVVRTHQDVTAVARTLKNVMRNVDPSLPVYAMTRLERLSSSELAWTKTLAALLAAFGMAALVIACLGTAGVMLYSVNARAHELAVRIAVGGSPVRILYGVMGRGLLLLGPGLALGVLASELSRPLVASQVPAVATGAWSLAVWPVVILSLCQLLAVLVPAWRASRMNALAVTKAQ